MNEDPNFLKLKADVDAIRRRIAQQMADDPDHEVALAMMNADFRRAVQKLSNFEALHRMPRAA